MSITSGFFNSINGDRKYNAEQMSAIFDGLINDGIYMSIGTAFVVEASTGNEIIVGKGRAWFNSAWVYNDAPLPITLDDSELLLDRYDAVVIEVNHGDAVREGTVKIIKGTPASEPVYPTLSTGIGVNQYPLAYIYRTSNASEITQADITNMVGSEQTPFVTGIVETLKLDVLLQQWSVELDEFIAEEDSKFNAWLDETKATMDSKSDEFDTWIIDEKAKFDALYADMQQMMIDTSAELDAWTDAEKAAFTEWSDTQKTEMLTWFDYMKDKLSENTAVSLQNQIDTLNTDLDKSEIEQILMIGFSNGDKVFSDDGSVVTATDSNGRTLVKTFTDSFSVCTTLLTDTDGTVLGQQVKHFSADGQTINAEITIN